jgi:uncharacterized protein
MPMDPWMVLSALLVLAGLAGTVLPALPGATLVLAGILVGAWSDGFQRMGPGLLALCTTLLGAQRAGASRLALAGAALGTVAGILSGLVGLLFFPLAGAAAGQYLEERHAGRAVRVGLATWIGLLLGAAVKVTLVMSMIGIYLAALIFG